MPLAASQGAAARGAMGLLSRKRPSVEKRYETHRIRRFRVGPAPGGRSRGQARSGKTHPDATRSTRTISAMCWAVPGRPAFRIKTRAEAIGYSVSDYTGRTVAEGTIKPENGAATLRPEVNALGYFHVRLTLKMKDSPPIEKQFDFGVLRPLAGIDVSESPFGVMTHFARIGTRN